MSNHFNQETNECTYCHGVGACPHCWGRCAIEVLKKEKQELALRVKEISLAAFLATTALRVEKRSCDELPPDSPSARIVQAPQVNLNGSSKESLMTQVRDAAEACSNLQCKLAEMRPHGRDYQTAPEGSYQKAREEAHQRELKVQSVDDDLHTIYQQLMMQGR